MINKQSNLLFVALSLILTVILTVNAPADNLLLTGLFLYWLANGLTEGYQYASLDQRKNNILIHETGFLDYHSWRLIENAGVLIAIGGMAISQVDIKALIGAWLVGWFVYDTSFAYVLDKKFGERTDYKCGF